MDIDKRIDEIVESLSVEKLIQFGIAHALSCDSYAEYFSAYCQHYEEISAYTNKVFWTFVRKIENRWSRTPQHTSHAIDDALYQAGFLLRLWGDCYQHVGNLNQKMLGRLARLADQLAAIAYSVPGALDCGGDVEDLLAKLLLTHGAIATIRDRYFGGCPIIFKDDNEKLNVLIAEAEEMALVYNDLVDAIERACGQNRLPKGQVPSSKLEVAKIKVAATQSSCALVQSLVAVAKSGAHAALGHGKLATEILLSEFKNQH